MNTKLVALLLLVLSVATFGSAQAQMTGPHDPHAATVHTLHMCLEHAAEQGHIANAGIVRSLHAKLDAAQQAVDREQPTVAITLLHAFLSELDAQAGKHIVGEHAGHLRMHTEMVIAAVDAE